MLEAVKSAMLSELELAYYQIFLEKFGWETEGIVFEDNLLITALEVKVNMYYPLDVTQ